MSCLQVKPFFKAVKIDPSQARTPETEIVFYRKKLIENIHNKYKKMI